MKVSFSAQKNFGVANPEKQQLSATVKKNLGFEGVGNYRLVIPDAQKTLLGLNQRPILDLFNNEKVTKGTQIFRFITNILESANLRVYRNLKDLQSVRLLRDHNHPLEKEGNSVLTFFTNPMEIKQLDEAMAKGNTSKVNALISDVPEENVFKIESIAGAMKLLKEKLIPESNGAKISDRKEIKLMNVWDGLMQKRLKSNLW